MTKPCISPLPLLVQDLIRFGKFLQPRQQKPEPSDPKYLLFPIPNGQLAANPNLEQNPGY